MDDEAIGAAGYAIDAIENGAEVYVVFLTAGDCNRLSARLLNRTLGPTAAGYLVVGRTRIAEAHSAMRLLGVSQNRYFILGYPDRGLQAMLESRSVVVRARGTRESTVPYAEALSPGAPYNFASIMGDLQRVFEIARPTTVIAPVAFDFHPDHRAAAEMMDLTIGNLSLVPQRLGYLVHSALVPLSLVPRTGRALVPPSRMRSLEWATYPLNPTVRQKKDALLRTYRSQGPYASILRNAFVRTNELFFVSAPQGSVVAIPASEPPVARAQLAR